MNKKIIIFSVLLLINLSCGTFSYAQEKAKPLREEQKVIVFRDALERDTPRGTARGFLKAVRNRDYKQAAEFLNLDDLPNRTETPTELARKLKIILHQKLWFDIEKINNTSAGSKNDNLPQNQELLGVIRTDHATYNIILQRVLKNNLQVWQISSQTVRKIPDIYEKLDHGVLIKIMPPILLEITVFKITAAEWISLVVILVITFLVVIILSKLFIFILKIFKSKKILHFFNVLLWPIRWLFIVTTTRYIMGVIAYSVNLNLLMKSNTIPIIISAWFLFNLIDYLFERWSINQKNKGKHDIVVFYNLLKKGLKLLILFIGITVWLDNLGFKVTTIIAGLGVGGIAVALAAQKTIEDILGAMTLLGARPIEVGDFVKFEDKLGTIEDISLRLTKIRTLDRTLINIPNSKFASLDLENLSKRDKIRFHPKIHLSYDTTSDQLRCILDEIKKTLSSNKKVLKEPLRVRFKEFGTYSLECDIFAYIDTKDYSEYLKIAEELHFSIMDIIEKAGTRLAIRRVDVL